MSPLSDEYISSLEPETLRYDVTIFDDFVISVLPNGIKTWAFLYDYEGRKRRKTLGVYPDMSYEQAEDALDNVRGMISKLGEDIKDSPVEDDTPTVAPPQSAVAQPIIVPTPEPPPEQRPAVLAPHRRYRHERPTSSALARGWVKPFGLGLAAVIALAAAVVLIPRLGLFDSDSNASKPAPLPSATPERSAPKPIILDGGTPVAEPDETPSTESTSSPEPVATTQVPPPEPIATIQVAEPEPVAAPVQVAQAPARDPPADPIAAAPPPATPRAADTSPSEPAEPAFSNPTPPTTLATSANGNVTRSVVTSNVQDLEPVDDLGENLSLNDAGFQTVFYFTELRNFSAGNIVHRWTYNGRVIADVPLRVDGGWRWRTYSSKDLLPGMTGDWSVAVIDADGRTLGERRFRFDR